MKSINKSKEGVSTMFKPKFKFTHDVELKNQLISEGRYTDAVDDLLIKFVE